MLFDTVPPIIKRFEEYGYARCGYLKQRTGFKFVKKGDIYEIAKFVKDDTDFYLYLQGQNGKFKVYYFKPATKKEFEKHNLVEALK